MQTEELGDLTLSEIWPVWWEKKRQEIGPKTANCYREYKKPLLAFFGAMKLGEIQIADIVSYRSGRVTAGPGLINHEINCLSQILDMAGLWVSIAKFYKPLRVPRCGPGQALLEQEALWLLEVASTRKRWEIAYFGSMLSANTACGHGEIRKLRLKDLDLTDGVIHIVEGAKNDYRVRSIPLNADARWAAANLLELATKKGAYLPNHYLIPARPKRLVRDPNERDSTNKSHPDPTRPMGSWKTAWYSLRREAAKRFPKLATVRMYDLRHHALTTLLENPTISEQTIKDIAGHVSRRILERYSHIRIDAKRKAVQAICNDGVSRTPIISANPPAPVGLVQWTASTLFGSGAPTAIADPITTAAHRKLRLVKG